MHDIVHDCFLQRQLLSWVYETGLANFHQGLFSAFALGFGVTSRNKSLKVLLARVPFGTRQFFVRMNGQPWPKDGKPASMTRVMTALRKALVKSTDRA